jgi:hypothetical protein
VFLQRKSEINASTLVDAKVKAEALFFIYEKPKQINKDVFIGQFRKN